MTTLTDNGRDWYANRAIGASVGRLSAVSVGTGSGSEATGSSSLGNEVYKADSGDSVVDFTKLGNTGEVSAVIEITGGTEVSAGTAITEMGIFGGFDGDGGPLVWVDEFPAVTIEAGHTRKFEIVFDHN